MCGGYWVSGLFSLDDFDLSTLVLFFALILVIGEYLMICLFRHGRFAGLLSSLHKAVLDREDDGRLATGGSEDTPDHV